METDLHDILLDLVSFRGTMDAELRGWSSL